MEFIGISTLEQIARQIMPEIAMSAYYDRQAVFDKFGVNVISGIQFKNIKYLLLRKGHTTRRKQIGTTLQSTAGVLLERELVTYLAWNRYKDNKDAYRELPLVDQANGTVSYPVSEAALRAVMANYSDDIYDNVWHGNHLNDPNGPLGYLGLFDGFFTNISNDIAKGYIKPIVLSGVITAPATTADTQAYDLFKEFRSKWDVHLQNAPKVIVAMNDITADAIADAYSNSKGNHQDVIRLENGNYKFPHWSNIEVAYDATIGSGTKMIAYTPGNLEYGVDTQNEENGIDIQLGSDMDAKDIFFQPQSAQGTRVYNISPSAFACTSDSLSPVGISGDYTKSTYDVTVNNAAMGSVTVNGEAPVAGTEYPAGTTLALVATPAASHHFVKWSDGSTEAEHTVVTTGLPESIVATFAHD